ncbi:hypothetical protein QTP70_031331 [Hemibagrus guttatus]|uniref:VLIG-type G domain-containing protein n=1 Tax=Hemibagrus guttatus TaxID=175788 RepID=A0AAE0QZV8_9TELE|nr:hypothetical protein QTP70_031331 [Hemibagrus guttatus]
MTKTMEIFIDALLGSDDTERALFLKWMGLKMDMRSRKHMSNLRRKYKECEQKKDREAIARLDKELLDSSLGIEHYMREMGQIYEAASFGSNKISDKISSLPTLAAKLLLAGFPIELLDGDASNIPEKWNYKDHEDEVTDEDLKADFERMWTQEMGNIPGLTEKDVPCDVLMNFRSSFEHRNVTQYLQTMGKLTQYGKKQFKAKKEHVKLGKLKGLIYAHRSVKHDLQNTADNVISSCFKMTEQFAQSKGDYQTAFTKDLLDEINEHLKKAGTNYDTKFEFDLKLHICGIASRKFTEMHRKYLAEQDPLKHLKKFKSQYLSDFIDLYRKRDQCHRKAREFTQVCLNPAVTEYIDQSIGPDIVDAVLKKHPTEYSSRVLFQYTIQKELLEKSNFEDFNRYILQYNDYVKEWIYNRIVKCFSKDISLQNIKMKKLDSIMQKIMKAMEASKVDGNGSPLPNNERGAKTLIQNFCKSMNCDISISMKKVKQVLFQNTADCASFTKSLYECIEEMKIQLKDEISNSDIKETLNNVSVKPQSMLFKRVFGCGKKCPFCKTPCEAEGTDHQQHHAAVHRPKGLCGSRNDNVLCEEICTSSVLGNRTFKNQETDFEPQLYKDYRKYYPDWHIAPDMYIEASDYWKYVMVTFNKQFAECYKAEQAVYPDEWKKITKEQVLISLKKNILNIKY